MIAPENMHTFDPATFAWMPGIAPDLDLMTEGSTIGASAWHLAHPNHNIAEAHITARAWFCDPALV